MNKYVSKNDFKQIISAFDALSASGGVEKAISKNKKLKELNKPIEETDYAKVKVKSPSNINPITNNPDTHYGFDYVLPVSKIRSDSRPINIFNDYMTISNATKEITGNKRASAYVYGAGIRCESENVSGYHEWYVKIFTRNNNRSEKYVINYKDKGNLPVSLSISESLSADNYVMLKIVYTRAVQTASVHINFLTIIPVKSIRDWVTHNSILSDILGMGSYGIGVDSFAKEQCYPPNTSTPSGGIETATKIACCTGDRIDVFFSGDFTLKNGIAHIKFFDKHKKYLSTMEILSSLGDASFNFTVSSPLAAYFSIVRYPYNTRQTDCIYPVRIMVKRKNYIKTAINRFMVYENDITNKKAINVKKVRQITEDSNRDFNICSWEPEGLVIPKGVWEIAARAQISTGNSKIYPNPQIDRFSNISRLSYSGPYVNISYLFDNPGYVNYGHDTRLFEFENLNNSSLEFLQLRSHGDPVYFPIKQRLHSINTPNEPVSDEIDVGNGVIRYRCMQYNLNERAKLAKRENDYVVIENVTGVKVFDNNDYSRYEIANSNYLTNVSVADIKGTNKTNCFAIESTGGTVKIYLKLLDLNEGNVETYLENRHIILYMPLKEEQIYEMPFWGMENLLHIPLAYDPLQHSYQVYDTVDRSLEMKLVDRDKYSVMRAKYLSRIHDNIFTTDSDITDITNTIVSDTSKHFTMNIVDGTKLLFTFNTGRGHLCYIVLKDYNGIPDYNISFKVTDNTVGDNYIPMIEKSELYSNRHQLCLLLQNSKSTETYIGKGGFMISDLQIRRK